MVVTPRIGRNEDVKDGDSEEESESSDTGDDEDGGGLKRRSVKSGLKGCDVVFPEESSIASLGIIGEDKVILKDLHRPAIILLVKYVKAVCQLSWSMILDDPPSSFYPSTFHADGNVSFNESIHTRAYGSKGSAKMIYYYFWPTFHRKDVELDSKISAVVRDKAIEKFKR